MCILYGNVVLRIAYVYIRRTVHALRKATLPVLHVVSCGFNLDFLATKIMTTKILFVTCLGVLWTVA